MTSTSLPPSLLVIQSPSRSPSFLPLSFSFFPSLRHDGKCREVSALTRWGFSSLGILWSLSLSFNFNFNALHWQHSWKILAEHQKPLSPSIPLFFSALHPLLWISLTFNFWNFIFSFKELNWHQTWTSVSLTHTLWPLPHFQYLTSKFQKKFLWSSPLNLFLYFGLIFFLRFVLSSVSNLNLLPSQWVRFAVWQQVCLKRPRQTLGNLHCPGPNWFPIS